MGSDSATHVVLGAGPVGRAVLDRLAERGIGSLVLTRSGATHPAAASAALDITDAEALGRTLAGAGAKVVFQCAQPPYHRWRQEFPALQASVLDACERAGARLVAVENLYGYGQPAGPFTEATAMTPTTVKGRVRADMWRALEAANESGRVATAAVRASDFVGPGIEESAFGTRFFGPIAAGKKAQVLGDPTTRHSVAYVPDLAEAMVRVGDDPSAFGRAWHAPSAPAVTQEAMVELAASIAGTKPRIQAIGPTLLRLVGLFSPGARETVEMLYEFTSDFVIDSSAFEARFGQAPTPLEESFAATLAALR